MKGNNSLLMNEATMIEAMQYYVSNVLMKPATKVSSVKSYNEDNYYQGFRVELTEFESSATA